MPDPVTYETLHAASLRTGVSTKTLRRRIAEGKLTAYRAGPRLIRLDPAEVDRLMTVMPARSGNGLAEAIEQAFAVILASHEPFAPEQVARLRELLAVPRAVRTPDSAA